MRLLALTTLWPPFGFAGGSYRVYLSASKSKIWDAAPIAEFSSGLVTGGLDLTGYDEDVDYWAGIRVRSAAGVVEANTDRIFRVRISGGALVGPPPNAVAFARAYAEAAGKVRLEFSYNAANELGAATGLQVCYVTSQAPDWANLIQTIAFSGTTRRSVVLDPTFTHGRTVRLAVRAVAAAGATGHDTWLAPVVADAEAPIPVRELVASQAEED